MIKICYVTTVPITIEVFIMDCAKYLKNTGDYEITFVCNEDEEFAKKIPEGIKYQPIVMARGISLSGFSAVLKMYQFFKKEKFDIVQYSTPNASCYASIAAYFAKVPVRLYCQWGIAYVGFSGIKRKIFKVLEKSTCTLSTTIEPDSFGNLEFSKKEGLYHNKGHVVGNGSASGVNFERFDIKKKESYNQEIRQRYNIKKEDIVFGFVGRIDKDKGFDELLEAYRTIKTEYTKLMIVGPSDKVHTANQGLYEESKNDDSIIYVGRTSEVEKFFSAFDIFVLPSYREGFGSVVIEAQSMGVPVIVTNIPGPSEAMSSATGLLVGKKNVSELAQAMKKLLEDNNLRLQLQSQCVEFARKYDQNILFQRIDEDRKHLISIVK